jgi:hypothetical protein
MTISQLNDGTQFQMYHDVTQLAGRVTLQPKGATGYGTATLYEGTSKSKLFQMRTMEMDAARTEFTLRSTKYNDIAFQAENMRSHIDYEDHSGQFTSNDSLQRILLPALGYAAWVDRYTWRWDEKWMALDNSKSMTTDGIEGLTLRERARRLKQMPGARFESTDPKLANIRFCAINSAYRYDDLELSNHNVYALPIADALIAPGGDSLHISQGGMMSMIEDGQLLFPVDSAFHLFYKCNLVVKNGKQYSGKGTIDYVSMDEKKQPIQMTEIAPNEQGVSVAMGQIDDSAQFTLSPAFGFAGKVRADATRLLMPSMRRLISPPDATSPAGRRGWFLLAEKRNSTRSEPEGERDPLSSPLKGEASSEIPSSVKSLFKGDLEGVRASVGIAIAPQR